MTDIVELLRFVKKIRSEHDPANYKALSPEFQGLHYFYHTMQILYGMQPENITWACEICANLIRGQTLREDEGFIYWLSNELIDNNHEPSVQALLSKIYWLCQNADGDALFDELVSFYEDPGVQR